MSDEIDENALASILAGDFQVGDRVAPRVKSRRWIGMVDSVVNGRYGSFVIVRVRGYTGCIRCVPTDLEHYFGETDESR